MNAPDPTREGLLLDSERDELLLMLSCGLPLGAIDLRARDFLLARGAMTAWEVRLRATGKKIGFLFGNHRIFASIGWGETYGVYLGQNLFTGRVDALKVMHLAVDNAERRARHLRKLLLQSSIDSPHFVPVYDSGDCLGATFAAVEYIRGRDLRAVIKRHGRLPMMTAANILSQTAAAIGAVHARGLVYGSIQPNKVLVAESQTIKLCDAGEGEPLGSRSGLAQFSGRVFDFISPEILGGDEVSPSADIYSLGCLLYYAVTGKVPFPGGSEADKRGSHLYQYPLDPRRLASDLDDAFVAVLVDMMAKAPDKRIQSPAEVVARLEPWGRREAEP